METRYFAITLNKTEKQQTPAVKNPKRRHVRAAGFRPIVSAAAAAFLILLLIFQIAGKLSDTSHSQEPIAMTMAAAPMMTLQWQQLPAPSGVLRDSEPDEKQAAHPFTAEEIDMLAQTLYAECNYLSDKEFGVSKTARKAAVAWCILNRYDLGSYGDNLGEVISAPAQFAWKPDAPVIEELRNLAEDVCTRWWAEKQGLATAERRGSTLPRRYIYFGGENFENWFRTEYDSWEDVWDWDCQDPYKEGVLG